MTQFSFGIIDPNEKSGTQLAVDLNNFRDALHSSHKGAARPTYAVTGMIWVKEISSSRWDIMFVDGVDDVVLRSYNPTTKLLLPLAVNQGGTGGTSVASAQAALGVLAAAQAVAQDSATGAAKIPSGTTAQRPASPSVSMFRYNTTLKRFEGYSEGAWGAIGGGGGSGGTTSVIAIVSGVLDLSAATTDTVMVSLDQNVTSITLPLGAAGVRKELLIQLTQDATGGRTVKGWPTSRTVLQWQGNVPPVIASAPSAMTQVAMSNSNNTAWLGYSNMIGGTTNCMLRIPTSQRAPVMCGSGAALVAFALVAARAYFLPFIPHRRMKLSALAVNVTTLLAGAGTLGIYAADGDVDGLVDYPGTLLAKCADGTINTGTTGTKLGSLDFVLEPGITYFLSVVHSSAVALRSIPIAAQQPVLGFLDNMATVVSAYYAAAPTNLLPNPAPAVTPLVSTTIPCLFLVE